MDNSGDGSDQPLIVSTNSTTGNSFDNQGQIDWINLYRTVISTSVDVLARLSGAGVDPFTVAVGQTIASRFKLSRLGTDRLNNALCSLRCVSGVGEALWFGFGVKHILRTLVQTAEGASCVMLCSSLTETHNAQYAAKVLAALTDLYSSSPSPTATPSIQHWLSIINTCSGTLASSPFGALVEQMLSLAGDSRVVDRPERLRVAGDPSDVAKALKALGQMSRRELTSMTITGGAECGWIAAVAYWFFEVSVEIKNADGEILYRGSDAMATPRMIVIYDKQEHQTVQVIGVSYVIRDIPRSLLYQDGTYGSMLYGRVVWDKAIQQTFGDPGRKLLRMTDFGTAVGSAARIFSALSRVEPKSKLSRGERRVWSSYADSSHGRGFVHLMTERLPETVGHKSRMEAALETSYGKALAEYEVALTRIARTCECMNCCVDVRAMSSPDSDEILLLPFCMPTLCETLIRLVWHLSTCSLDASIQPSRVGLEMLYNQHLQRCQEQDASRKDVYHNAKTLLSQLGFEISLPAAALIFTGQEIYSLSRSDRQYHKPAPAAVVSGVCFYLGILREFSDAPETATRIHVIPGRIESRSARSFNYLDDAFEVSRRPMFTYSASQPAATTLDSLMDMRLQTSPSLDILPIVEETTSGLTIFFQVKSPGGTASIGPLLLAEKLVGSSGMIACARLRCLDFDSSKIPMVVVKGEGQLSAFEIIEAGHRIVLRQVTNLPIARALALFVDDSHDNDGTNEPPDDFYHPHTDDYDPLRRGHTFEHLTETIIQRDECLSCTLRTAVDLSSKGGVAYVVLRSMGIFVDSTVKKKFPVYLQGLTSS